MRAGGRVTGRDAAGAAMDDALLATDLADTRAFADGFLRGGILRDK